MSEFLYTPDEDIQVHEEGAIRLICGPFRSHENGLPEWLKNAADAYAREDAPEEKRVIVVIFDYGGERQPSISCLDFSGMTSAMIEENFRIWADPEAAYRGLLGKEVQGGHGSGGKCYMVQMFDGHAFVHTVKGSHGSRYGVAAHSLKFGYIPDKTKGRDFGVEGIRDELQRVLAPLRCPLDKLPKEAESALKAADGFTLVSGVLPKGYKKKIPYRHLIESLQNDPQMIRTLGLCRVFVVVNSGKRTHRTIPLGLPEVEPMPGAEEPRRIDIPEILRDPASGLEVSTTRNGKYAPGQLELKTSRVSMRWKWKRRHSILFMAQSGYIGFLPVPELDVSSHFRDHIYGRCVLESLEEAKQSDRRRLADADLTRAVGRFIAEQVQSFAQEFEVRERRMLDQMETGALSRMSDALDHWKDGFLHTFVQERWGVDLIGAEPAAPLPAGKPGRIDLSLAFPMAGVGVAFKPRVRFFTDGGDRIRSQPYVLMSDNEAVASVDEELMLIKSRSPGRTTLRAETFDRTVQSAAVPLEVAKIREITVKPRRINMHVGGRKQLEASCLLENGGESEAVYLDWREEDPETVRVSASGLVFGIKSGRTKVVAADGNCRSNPAALQVSPRKTPPSRSTSPTVLISGEVHPDPDTGEYVYFSAEDAPVMQRPEDVERNIWWINGAAPLARLYLDPDEGYGYDSREWRIYLVERFIDVLAQIIMVNIIQERESLSAEEWILTRGSLAAEIQATAVRDLQDFIHEGTLPQSRSVL